jgi:hypothetical protein
VVESGVRLLGIPWAELVKERVQDQWSVKGNDFRAYLRLNVCRICLGRCQVEVRAKEIDGSVLEGVG